MAYEIRLWSTKEVPGEADDPAWAWEVHDGSHLIEGGTAHPRGAMSGFEAARRKANGVVLSHQRRHGGG